MFISMFLRPYTVGQPKAAQANSLRSEHIILQCSTYIFARKSFKYDVEACYRAFRRLLQHGV